MLAGSRPSCGGVPAWLLERRVFAQCCVGLANRVHAVLLFKPAHHEMPTCHVLIVRNEHGINGGTADRPQYWGGLQCQFLRHFDAKALGNGFDNLGQPRGHLPRGELHALCGGTSSVAGGAFYKNSAGFASELRQPHASSVISGIRRIIITASASERE